MFDFTEMDKLQAYLDKKSINYVRKSIHDGQQIIAFDEKSERCWDVVLHSYSYGCEDNLLEAMGDILDHDDVEGYLTAENVIDYIEHKR